MVGKSEKFIAAAPPASLEEDVQVEEFEVEKIIRMRCYKNGRIKYLVRWKGYTYEHDTWEPVEHLENCDKLIEKFHSTPKVILAKKRRSLKRKCSPSAFPRCSQEAESPSDEEAK